jgi:3-deoxy-manno-octulosonate cytidylyltransferase (CMP-KDO synthetase)
MNSNKFWVIIPARYASTRLPKKPLLNIAGKPMLQHVYEKACNSNAERVLIATDDQRIYDVCKTFNAEVYLTDINHQSGTDRIAEVAQFCQADDETIIVNLQGDEPLMPVILIDQVAQALIDNPQANIASLCKLIDQKNNLENINSVKVVRDKHDFALYFSRAIIPLQRDSNKQLNNIYREHIGIYAYRKKYLDFFSKLAVCDLEKYEALEQLRVLFHCGKIYIPDAKENPPKGVDTIEDLERVCKILN